MRGMIRSPELHSRSPNICAQFDRAKRCKVTATIRCRNLFLEKCNFFLDTLFSDFYTFVNCSMSAAGSMSHRKGRIDNHGNEKGSQEASKESSEEGSKEEVRQQQKGNTKGEREKRSPSCFCARNHPPGMSDNKSHDTTPLDRRYMG
jgi:hypothetical protein